MKVQYQIFQELSSGPIKGAKITYEDLYVPNESVVITLACKQETLDFRICTDEEVEYDPSRTEARVNLIPVTPDYYLVRSQRKPKHWLGHLFGPVFDERFNYEKFAKEMIMLAADLHWDLIGNRNNADPSIQHLFKIPGTT